MAYQANLSDTQKVIIGIQGTQTQVTLIASTPRQQQSQSCSLLTGAWIKPPVLWRSAQGFILQVDGAQNRYFILLNSNSIQIIDSMPVLENAIEVELATVADPVGQTPLNFEPMQPMQPMQPMRMGNMSMDLNSMSMQMGDMSLDFDNRSKPKLSKNFCSQCGVQAKQGDRFCRNVKRDRLRNNRAIAIALR